MKKNWLEELLLWTPLIKLKWWEMILGWIIATILIPPTLIVLLIIAIYKKIR